MQEDVFQHTFHKLKAFMHYSMVNHTVGNVQILHLMCCLQGTLVIIESRLNLRSPKTTGRTLTTTRELALNTGGNLLPQPFLHDINIKVLKLSFRENLSLPDILV